MQSHQDQPTYSLDRVPELQRKLFLKLQNAQGKRMCNEFINFLHK